VGSGTLSFRSELVQRPVKRHGRNYNAGHRIQFFLSRDAFRDIAPVLDAARGSVLDKPLGRLLGDYMLALERRLPTLTPLDVPALTKAVQAMVAAALLASPTFFGAASVTLTRAGGLSNAASDRRRFCATGSLNTQRTTSWRLILREVAIAELPSKAWYRPALTTAEKGDARALREERLVGHDAPICDRAHCGRSATKSNIH
jgi:hypothetical protein